ncbi:ribonuclease E activity regulator RraA [Ramlibacter sp.]|uniref:ribonuclease E activity regulator RraA n=1 Tax=Ramlibacter sp. TaxID=1917967 RepID=UPI002C613575|nr:ribonuclease E activity regulator RraA [Ramlibacter sp.]HWI83309.1 ribonuclease E activity regulator RraA [Ramlibacter sp.]
MTPKTSDLCDACEGALACALPLRGWGRRRAFAGAIRTIRCHEDIALMRDVVGQPGRGNVLVIDGGGSLARALFGDVMAGLAVRNGWAGLVINGAIRDGVEIDAMDIGVKALGTVPRRGERTGAGAVDVPVSFGGITFTPGQRLVADEDGVIVLPAGLTENDIRTDEVVAATAAYVAAPGPR